MRQTANELSRRDFLTVLGALPLLSAVAGSQQARPAAAIPIAVQLYSVRGESKRDFDAALEQVAAMGFAGVEFAGYYNYAGRPTDLAKRLEMLKLKAAGTHIGLDTLQGDALQKTIEFHQAIGCRFLVVPSNRDFTDPDKSKALAETFNRLAESLKPLGMATGYHNHTGEFKQDGGRTFWDLFAERTSKDVILQQDCGWTAAAGFDPVQYIRKYPGRARTVHFKPYAREGDTGKKAILGQDSVDWRAVYDACASTGGTEWIVIEQETYPDGKSATECTRESLEGLKRIVRTEDSGLRTEARAGAFLGACV
ncbi:MAG: sugar phosphate isomerase/epimerase family protein [Vicinamibacterales bacterium]